jgi:hypothetical protein
MEVSDNLHAPAALLLERRSHWSGVWMYPGVGLNIVAKRKFLVSPGIEPWWSGNLTCHYYASWLPCIHKGKCNVLVHATKVCVCVSAGIAPVILNFAFDGGECALPCLSHFITRKTAPNVNVTGSWVDLHAHPDDLEMRNISCLCPESNWNSLVPYIHIIFYLTLRWISNGACNSDIIEVQIAFKANVP